MNPDLDNGVSGLTGFLAHDMRASLRFAQLNLSNLEEAIENGNEDSLHKLIAALRARLEGADNLLARLRQYGRAIEPAAMLETVDVSNLSVELERLMLACNFEPRCSGPSISITTSRRHLRLILTELVDNAIRHHDEARGVIAVQWQPCPDSILFTVHDDGPGIPAEFQERVFELGRTLQAKDTRKNAGVGLSIVSRILRSIGAEFGIRSEAPQRRGTMVYFRWPLDLPASLANAGETAEVAR